VIELAVLDIAGTTVEEHQAVYRALTDAVTAAGAHPTARDIEQWMGADKHEAITALLGGVGDPVQVYADFRRRLAAAYAERPPTPLPSIPEALAELRAGGVRVALTTGFDRDVTSDLLGMLGWDETVVDAVICVDDVAAGRPAPYLIFQAMEATGVRDVRRVIVAGDTTRDLQAGCNAGVAAVVGVLTGGQDAATLGAEQHTHILPSVADLPALVARLQKGDSP
jgi:phosphonatase-like hydrolase